MPLREYALDWASTCPRFAPQKNLWETEGMWRDPIVEEIRRIREEHAARFNYDLRAIYRDLKEKEKQSGRKMASLKPVRPRPIGRPQASRKITLPAAQSASRRAGQ